MSLNFLSSGLIIANILCKYTNILSDLQLFIIKLMVQVLMLQALLMFQFQLMTKAHITIMLLLIVITQLILIVALQVHQNLVL